MLGISAMSAEQYHADPCPTPSLSRSILQTLITRSPAHAYAQHPRLNPDVKPMDSSKFDLGSAAHDLLLEGGTGKICVIDFDDYRTKDAKTQRDAARAAGLYPVLKKHNDDLQAMVETARDFMAGTELAREFDAGVSEQTLIWEEDDLWFRARPDRMAINRSVVFDYKTTERAEPEYWGQRLLVQNGYDIQSGVLPARAGEDPGRRLPH